MVGYRRRRMDKHNKGDEKISRHTYFFCVLYFEMKHDCLIHGGNTQHTQKMVKGGHHHYRSPNRITYCLLYSQRRQKRVGLAQRSIRGNSIR